MRLVETTASLSKYYHDKSIASPLEGLSKTPFKHVDMSMYNIIYKDSPWISKGDLWKKEVESCHIVSDKFGLDFCQAHSPDGNHFIDSEDRDNLILATKRSIEACAMLEIPHTVLHAQGVAGATPTDFIKKNIEFLKIFEEDAERFNVDLLIENSASLWNPDYYIRTGKEMREFVEMAKMPRLHICWDIGHGNVQGCNQFDDFVSMGEELHAIHVHDNYGNADAHVMPLVGTTNFDNVIRGLLKIGYKGDFTFEAGCTLRNSKSWPILRRNVTDKDILANPPIDIQIKQLSLNYEIGKWMLESYNINVE